MITSVRLRNFKNFADETPRMGPFTVLVGANASGKSNVRDALRFLHGVGRGYRLADIIGGRYGARGQVEWAPIRGGVDEIVRFGEDGFRLAVHMRLKWLHDMGQDFFRPWDYELGVRREPNGSSPFRVSEESLCYSGETTFTSRPDRGDPILDEVDSAYMPLRLARAGTEEGRGLRLDVNRDWPGLVAVQKGEDVARHHKGQAATMQSMLANMRFLDFSPVQIRRPAFLGQTVLGDRGENLPTVVREICADPRRRDTLPGGGRRPLGEEAARRIDAIRRKCPEDFDALARRLEAHVASG